MADAPPLFARVLRGDFLESGHRGDAAVVDEEGGLLFSSGDPGRLIFPRSAAKPFQALPLIESDGAERFRLGAAEIALLCASHGGEPRHVRVARRLLSRGGFSPGDLVCGPQEPMDLRSARLLARRGESPTKLHNNCSGKHAGLLLACRLLGLPPKRYWEAAHPLQIVIRRRIARLGSVGEEGMQVAVDGCGLPVFSMPLAALALAYARLVSPAVAGEAPAERDARRLICDAMWEKPEMVAGRGRFTTAYLQAGRGRSIGKEGAEAVYAIGIRAPSRGEPSVGIAFKIEDGGTRARDAVALSILDQLGWLSSRARRELADFAAPPVVNAAGAIVGSIRAEVPIIRRDAPD
jgi:L-asparaginase II